jgi:Uma2 family endonuclease
MPDSTVHGRQRHGTWRNDRVMAMVPGACIYGHAHPLPPLLLSAPRTDTVAMPAYSEEHTRLWTAEELLAMPDDGMRHELVRGELRTMTPAGGQHGLVITWLTGMLFRYLQEHDMGALFSPDTGFHLASEPDTVRAPDIAFVSDARIPPGGIPRSYPRLTPDLAVEVLSPDDTVFEIEEKVEEYLVTGARLVWVINPKRRTATVYQPGAAARVLAAGDVLDGGEVLPGFACRVADVFTWVDRYGA